VRNVAYLNAAEEVGLAFDRGGGDGGIVRQIGERRGAAEIVGKRYERAAMHDAEPVAEFLTHRRHRS
jgi:hypothetical protein